MSFMLGSFTGGLFSGAEGVMKTAGMVQDYQDRSAQIAGANALRDASTDPNDPSNSGYTNPHMNVPNSDPSGTRSAISPVFDPTKIGAAGRGAGAAPAAGADAMPTPPIPPATPPATALPLASPVARYVPPTQPTAVPNYEGEPLPQSGGPVIWNGAGGLHRAAVGESGTTWSGAQGLHTTDPYSGTPPAAAPPTQPLDMSRVTNRPVGTAVSDWWNNTKTPENPPSGALPTPPIPPAQDAGTPAPTPGAAPSSGPSLGARIASSLNPIGSAQAAPAPAPAPAPTPALPPAQTDTSAPTPAAPAPTPPTQALPTAQASENATQPAQVAAQQAAQQPDPAGGPSAVTLPAQTAPVAPGQTTPTVQSEATPAIIKPPIDTQYYGALNPSYRSIVDRIALQEGVSPERLAAHWYAESSMQISSPDGKAGEKGVMQVLPSTRDMVDPHHQLDQSTLEGSLATGARYIGLMDREFGRDSAGSVVAYNGGPGTADAIARDPANAAKNFSGPMAYGQKVMGGAPLDATHFTVGTPPSPHELVQAAHQGPDQFVNYLAQTVGPGMQMSDKWRLAETSLVYAAARRGDYAGVAHARDMVLQMSQQGMMQNTMRADQALQNGDGAGAAQALAKAHTFFPDGTMGRFGVDASGNVWAQRVDEHDPSQILGKPFQVTHEGLMATMNQTRDPAAYVKMVNEQQTQAAKMRLDNAHAGYYEAQPQLQYQARKEATETRLQVAKETAQSRRDVAETNADAKEQAALDRGATAQSGQAAHVRAVDTEVGKAWGADNPPLQADGTAMTPQQRALGAQIHTDIRVNAPAGTQSGPHAQYLAEGVINKTLSVRAGADGRYAVVDPKDPNTPLGLISAGLGARLVGGGQSRSPIGSVPAPRQAIPTQNAPSTTTVQ